MKRPIQLLISNGETLESIDLQPAAQRNLQVWAKANKTSLSEMIKLALDFTTGTGKTFNRFRSQVSR
jgi:hypothetical protein